MVVNALLCQNKYFEKAPPRVLEIACLHPQILVSLSHFALSPILQKTCRYQISLDRIILSASKMATIIREFPLTICALMSLYERKVLCVFQSISICKRYRIISCSFIFVTIQLILISNRVICYSNSAISCVSSIMMEVLGRTRQEECNAIHSYFCTFCCHNCPHRYTIFPRSTLFLFIPSL